jgi:quinol monooxygenase YgiN
MITIVVKHFVHEDKIEEFMKLTRELISASREEPGCISYTLYEDTKDKTILTFIEVWENQEAIDAHFKRSAFTRIVPMFKPTLSAETEINMYKLV